MLNKKLGIFGLAIAAMGLAACGGRPAESSVAPTSEPAQQTSEPAAPTSEPAAPTSEPAAPTSEPAPETSEPAPETSEPAPETSEPAPETSEPAPETSEPAPETSEPAPETSEPAPVVPERPWVDLSEGESITYWCSETDTDFFEQKVNLFKELHPEFTGDIEFLATVGEGEVKDELIKDPEVAADIFELADDNVPGSVEARALTNFGRASENAWAIGTHGASAVDAFTVKGNLYALPYRNDNGYILSYDTDIVSDEQAETIEGIIEACEAAGAKFGLNLGNGWYSFAPVWAAGAKTYTDDEGIYHADMTDPEIADKLGAFGKLLKDHPNVVADSDDDSGFGETGQKKLGAVVKWNNYDSEKRAIGDRLHVAQLPSFTYNGEQLPLMSFQGFKGLGMRRASDFTEGKKLVAEEFCYFMASDSVAEARLTDLGQGVSNIAVAAKPELWESPWLNTLSAQGAAGNTVSQAKGASDDFWNPAAALGAQLIAGSIFDSATALEALEDCSGAINPIE